MENKDQVETNIVENKNNNLVEKFSRNIIRKNVHAKLLPGSKINGIEVELTHVFHDHGPNKDLSAAYFSTLGKVIPWIMKENYPGLINSHFLCIKEFPDEENKILAIVSFQDNKVDARGWTPTYVMFELPNKEADEFVEEVKKDPDLLEKIYQKEFDELESRNKKPGLRRTRSDRFYLITEKDRRELNLLDENQFKISNVTEKFKEFFDKLNKYHYRNGPYGSGNPYKPDKD